MTTWLAGDRSARSSLAPLLRARRHFTPNPNCEYPAAAPRPAPAPHAKTRTATPPALPGPRLRGLAGRRAPRTRDARPAATDARRLPRLASLRRASRTPFAPLPRTRTAKHAPGTPPCRLRTASTPPRADPQSKHAESREESQGAQGTFRWRGEGWIPVAFRVGSTDGWHPPGCFWVRPPVNCSL